LTYFRKHKEFELKLKEEEEALRKKFTEQVRQEEARFRQWEEKVCICGSPARWHLRS
jgi:septin family protein